MKKLDGTTFVSGQIAPEDVASLGVTMIVNNRPDGEEPGQPSSDEIEEAARAAGIDYRHIPVAGGFSPAQVADMADALQAADGPVLAFCKSGTRSTYLWALARSRLGTPADEIVRSAEEAGYDPRPIALYLS
jgi:uncharacterized protein (TIGR01244 family)